MNADLARVLNISIIENCKKKLQFKSHTIKSFNLLTDEEYMIKTLTSNYLISHHLLFFWVGCSSSGFKVHQVPKGPSESWFKCHTWNSKSLRQKLLSWSYL